MPPALNPSFVTIGCQKTVLLCNIQYYYSNVQPRLRLHLGEYLYEASEEYVLEGKIFKLTNKLLEVVLENYGK